ncbi:hypothetical protein K435DRAFT_928814 [Dendrothele bispora CBS 962.96]|uniref:Uncharacterized protein n=1 Tax=Dendrothele bispora (strain CBS 962.96) TaxID=1314807 RepID=A0A4S8L6B7_DENBC|nr:hypothetical protein K435DRAFT_928814 [Dendrothele bispora CBS 962.96]
MRRLAEPEAQSRYNVRLFITIDLVYIQLILFFLVRAWGLEIKVVGLDSIHPAIVIDYDHDLYHRVQSTPEKLDPFWSFLSWSLRTLIPAVNGSETLSPLWKVVLEPCLRVPHDGTGSRKLVTTQTDDIENNVRVPGMIEIATIPNRRRMNQLLLQLHHVEIPARFNDEFPKTLANEPQEGNETNMTEINISCPSGSHSPEAYDNSPVPIGGVFTVDALQEEAFTIDHMPVRSHNDAKRSAKQGIIVDGEGKPVLLRSGPGPHWPLTRPGPTLRSRSSGCVMPNLDLEGRVEGQGFKISSGPGRPSVGVLYHFSQKKIFAGSTKKFPLLEGGSDTQKCIISPFPIRLSTDPGFSGLTCRLSVGKPAGFGNFKYPDLWIQILADTGLNF